MGHADAAKFEQEQLFIEAADPVDGDARVQPPEKSDTS